MTFFFKKTWPRRPKEDFALHLYQKMLKQARLPEFYGNTYVSDSYDGRIDLLILHLAPLLQTLGTHGKDGILLAQELFDAMRDDFDMALREEGLSDSGVVRRIKPMIGLFYGRLKAYESLLTDKMALFTYMREKFLGDAEYEFSMKLSEYIIDFNQNLRIMSFSDIVQGQFSFPAFYDV